MSNSLVTALSDFVGDSTSFCIFGGGGGSDQETARLLAVSLVSCKKHSLKTITVITAFAGLYDRERPNYETEVFTSQSREQTKKKYTGKPYKSWQKTSLGAWEYAEREPSLAYCENECVTPISSDGSDDGLLYTTANPVVIEGVTIQSYGLVVVPPSESLLFPASRGLLRRLVCPTNPAVVEPILLVDTGGDGMKFYTQRSLPAGAPRMGDVDVTEIYGGVGDSRDTDSLRLCLDISRKRNGKLAFLVVGPGADGESSTEGIINTHELIRKNGSLLLEGSVNELIGVMDDHTSLPERHLLKLWLKPREFSTIAHITEAVKQREEQKSSSPAIEGSVVIKRRGVVVGPRPASFLGSFWLISGDVLEQFL